MNFEPTQEQVLISESAQSFAKAVAANPQRPEDEARIWRDLADNGWLGMAFPSDYGGMGLSGIELMLFCEALGAERVLSPYRMGAVVVGHLLHAAEDCAELLRQLIGGDWRAALAVHEPGVRFAPTAPITAAAATASGFCISGAKQFVPIGGHLDAIILPARLDTGETAVFRLDLSNTGIILEHFIGTDGSSAANVTLDSVEVPASALLARGTHAERLLLDAIDVGSALGCAEMAGGMGRLVDETRDYLLTRKQFGTPLAGFQVIQHRLADMTLEYQLARSAAMNAIAAVGSRDPGRSRAISLARIQCSQAAGLIGRAALQLHGGMGMTSELEIGWRFKRLLCLDVELGDADHHFGRCLRH
jgi:alkylation response protein AidB-like acyl-CoA dehydrogenase